jgi:hypothetical protein
MSLPEDIDKILKENEADWGKIQIILNKWPNPVIPPLVMKQVNQAENMFSQLLTKNIEWGNIARTRTEIDTYGEELGRAMADTFKGSYIIGLEFGSKNKGAERSEAYMSKELAAAAELVVPACFPMKVWMYKQLAIARATPEMTDPIVEALTKLLYQLSVECFKEGLRNSAKL